MKDISYPYQVKINQYLIKHHPSLIHMETIKATDRKQPKKRWLSRYQPTINTPYTPKGT
jgi:hypothetical protein